MTESDIVARTGSAPVTAPRIAADLRALGVREGGVLLVHASLSSLGWVCGGAQAAVQGLLEALGADGTLVVPTHTNHLSDPSGWSNPPVPEAWWDEVRATMPAFRPDETPAAHMGAVAETVLRRRDAVRSTHPHFSFAAIGPLAEALCGSHAALDWSLGPHSPIGRVGDHDGDVLLLGVGHESNTSLHVAETTSAWGARNVVEGRAPAMVDGRRQWVSWREPDYDEKDFPAIGAAFADATGLERVGPVGVGRARLLPQRPLVEFAAAWIDDHRD